MKHYLVFLFLAFLSLNNFAQDIKQTDTLSFKEKKWKLSTHLVSQPYIFNTDQGYPNLFTGIGITRKIGKFGVRLNYNYFDNDKSGPFTIDSVNSFEDITFTKEHALRLGIEYQANYSKMFSVLFFADYIFAPFNSNYTVFKGNEAPIISAETYGICNGATLGIGINFSFNEHISLSGETRLDFLSLQQNQEIKNYNNGTIVEYQTSQSTMNLKLIGTISINYHF